MLVHVSELAAEMLADGRCDRDHIADSLQAALSLVLLRLKNGSLGTV